MPMETCQPIGRRPGGRFGLREVRGLDASGAVVETYDLTFWDRMDRR